MAKCKSKETIWIDWEVTCHQETGDERDFFMPFVDIECGGGWHPDDIINRDSTVMKYIKEQIEDYKEYYYRDDTNFDPRYKYGEYDRDVDYQFKVRPFNNKKIKADVAALYKKYEGLFCPKCEAFYYAKDGNYPHDINDIPADAICWHCDEPRKYAGRC